MANASYNPIFKRPNAAPPVRLPSPPHALIEPLSPTKPVPLEPSFNYPAINDHVHFTVQPEHAYIATPRARAYSTSHQAVHQRTPSTIDTLADAALAASPSYPLHPADSTARPQVNGHYHAHPAPHHHGSSEPPHKRARSEFLPSPFAEQYVSRPATSYEPAKGWSGQTHAKDGFHSRVEEAALLLNFQSGGWPSDAPPDYSVPPASAQRPHAKSFPQDPFHARPAEMAMQQPTTLLPPFDPQFVHQPQPILSPPQRAVFEQTQRAVFEQTPAINFSPIASMNDKGVLATGAQVMNGAEDNVSHLLPTQTSQAGSEMSHPGVNGVSNMPADPPKRRGWPKGKPRGPGRKTLAEKAATKRAAARKKGPDAKASKTKSASMASPPSDVQQRARRKSVSDAPLESVRTFIALDLSSPARAKSVPLDIPMLVREALPSKAVRRKPAVSSDTICAGCGILRETTTSRGELDEWISCNGCKKWFHIDCAGFKKAHEVRDVDKFFCTACEPEHGKTTYVRKSTRAHASVDYAELQRGVLKTSEESVEHHYIQPIKDGMFTFDEETFPRMRPEMVTREFFERSGTFVEPICIPAEWNPRPWDQPTMDTIAKPPAEASEDVEQEAGELHPSEFEYTTVPNLGQDKLDMVMPQGLTVRQVCHLVGADWPIDVIDVKTQNSGGRWTLGRWADYYEDSGDEKAIRNVISLEVSQTRLGRLLQRPRVVRDMDLQDDVWPQEIDKSKAPKSVQFYCLMSVADSYTDFHIDFGGSSVYYHILKGKKTFFFIPPKPKHLKAYEEWNDSPQQNYTFLPSITKECYRVDLSEGDTLFIPSGWIHAVWTPEDSLVIGGNFLNRLSYKNQFKVAEIEKLNQTPMKFRYPSFQKVMWYTVLKYLKEDPLPEAVSQLFFDGKTFQRDTPIWADFDGDLAGDDARPGARNARYYSQAEVDGLPDLVNYIFRTVMLVMGRVEGISADRMKRVNASIPKGHGEPLDLAKSFALWVAWKRGNEDPPAWAHPDAVLPSGKEEGPPKKLSERKLKELERKEAIAAWRVAPDRQSERMLTKIAKDAAQPVKNEEIEPAPSTLAPAPAPTPAQPAVLPNPYLQSLPYTVPQPAAAPMQTPVAVAVVPSSGPIAAQPTFALSTIPGQYLSTPKTSVLGPKRVACDACRKRRIRCKHKDVVMQAPNGVAHTDGETDHLQSQIPQGLHENITVTPPKLRDSTGSFTGTDPEGQADPMYSNGSVDADVHPNGLDSATGQPLHPGTNTYLNANIPMAMNGVPIFGDVPKRGRSKACYECRKSKRRCIHDEHGNVDPIKASETPVPRNNVSTKKRSAPDDGDSPTMGSKTYQAPSDYDDSPSQVAQASLMHGHGVLKPQDGMHLSYSSQQLPGQLQPFMKRQNLSDQQHSPIDPSLFSPRTGASADDAACEQNPHVYTATSQNHRGGAQATPYVISSLEEIANEVLVDMNGEESSEQPLGAQPPSRAANHGPGDGDDEPQLSKGGPKTEESVDSAVSLPGTSVSEEQATDSMLANGVSPPAGKDELGAEISPLQDSVENPGPAAEEHVSTESLAEGKTTPARPKSRSANLSLYEPPVESTETRKQQSVLPNGVSEKHTSQSPASPSSAAGPTSTSAKRKRDSTAATPATTKTSSKKARTTPTAKSKSPAATATIPEDPDLNEKERQSLELAKALQQQDLGLRRRSK